MEQLIDFQNIKLIIWDLDDTFWTGTLSEGEVKEIPSNTFLVKSLTENGIINSICSKNDKDKAEAKLSLFGVLDYFVFNSIDWTPKGSRISSQIKEMGLRAQNVLFIDDNIVNLNEAKYYNESLMVSTPDIISGLTDWVNSKTPNDINHERLNRYKVLEAKSKRKSELGDNLKFLYSSNTRVKIETDCLNHIDRIHEMILRTNQLNYTKNRMSKDDLLQLIQDKDVNSGYVRVRDDFGDYGIVGFFAVKNNKCIHFLFSCRTIGQGVEQWVYAHLGYPEVNVVGEVVSKLSHEPSPGWINQEDHHDNEQIRSKDNTEIKTNGKILFKGPCDLSSLTAYLHHEDSIIEEFNYVNDEGRTIEHHNHSQNFVKLPFLSEKDRNILKNECLFMDDGVFNTHLYDNNISLIFLSSLQESALGVYRRKGTNIKVAFSIWDMPLDDSKNWNTFLSNDFLGKGYSKEWLKSFASKYEFVGPLSPEETLDNYKEMFSKISPKATLCIMLGSEMPYLANKKHSRENRHLAHRRLNDLLREWAKEEQRVILLDFNKYIVDQDSFIDDINHYSRKIYYQAALDVCDIIRERSVQEIRPLSWWARETKYVKKIVYAGLMKVVAIFR